MIWVLDGDVGGDVCFTKQHMNNIIYGDSDSFYGKLPSTITDEITVEDAVVIADMVCDMTNDSYNKFAMLAFNAPPERTKEIQSTREVVADSGILLTKKRYILRVVDDEGERANKLKIQGVELKKSDTSAAVKDMLNELVMMILDNKEMDEVVRRVSQMRNEFKQRPVHEIAVPCNTKTLTKVQKGYEATGSLKGAHYSAKSAFWWNKMKTPQDQEVYAGQKVGLVYVKHPKFDSIGFPIDLETLPDWFNKIPIDYDVMWEKAYKKLTNYLKAVEWDIESRRENKKKELFGF